MSAGSVSATFGINGDPPLYSGFSAGTGFFGSLLSGAIRLFSGGDVNHAFFIFWSPDFNAWLTVGANANGVTVMTVPEFRKSREIKYLFAPVSSWSLWTGLRTHVGDLDKHYNYTGLFGMANVEIVKKLLGRPGANLLNDRDDLFCSEWCSEVIRAALPGSKGYAVAFMSGYKADQIDPAALRDAESKSPFFVPVPLSAITKPPIKVRPAA
jgi:hypothetical protein